MSRTQACGSYTTETKRYPEGPAATEEEENHRSLSAIYFIYYETSPDSQLSDINGAQINPLGSFLHNKDMQGYF